MVDSQKLTVIVIIFVPSYLGCLFIWFWTICKTKLTCLAKFGAHECLALQYTLSSSQVPYMRNVNPNKNKLQNVSLSVFDHTGAGITADWEFQTNLANGFPGLGGKIIKDLCADNTLRYRYIKTWTRPLCLRLIKI